MTDPTLPPTGEDTIRELMLDSGLMVMVHVDRARRAPGGWRLVSAKGDEVINVFERFFSAIITPPDAVSLDEVFASLSINDVQTIVQLIAPFLAPETSAKRMR